jgi:hypothetical protein
VISEHKVQEAIELEQTRKSEISNSNKQLTSTNSRRHDVNILYIAVPLAAACVILAFVIFTLYLIKLSRRAPSKKGGANNQNIPTIYKKKVPLIVDISDREQYLNVLQCHQNTNCVCVKTCHVVAADDKTNHPDWSEKSWDVSRDSTSTSGGSETKLLV